jgi:NAD+ kinase
MKKIGIIFDPVNPAAGNLADDLAARLGAGEMSVWTCSAWRDDEAIKRIAGSDLILTVGGDGTILRAAQAIIPDTVPITGINLGNLGFMTELAADETGDRLDQLLAGEGWTDERALLQAEVTAAGESKPSASFHALNDVVVAHGDVARVIRVDVAIDDEPLTTYKADGIIVATATGSTGYALGAGGPILHPQARELVLLPIVPHLSASYKLVLSPASEIKLEIGGHYTATLTVDGHVSHPFTAGTTVTVRRSDRTIRFLRRHGTDSFYATLERRLKGKE